jgi:hypothetical protein
MEKKLDVSDVLAQIEKDSRALIKANDQRIMDKLTHLEKQIGEFIGDAPKDIFDLEAVYRPLKNFQLDVWFSEQSAIRMMAISISLLKDALVLPDNEQFSSAEIKKLAGYAVSVAEGLCDDITKEYPKLDKEFEDMKKSLLCTLAISREYVLQERQEKRN